MPTEYGSLAVAALENARLSGIRGILVWRRIHRNNTTAREEESTRERRVFVRCSCQQCGDLDISARNRMCPFLLILYFGVSLSCRETRIGRRQNLSSCLRRKYGTYNVTH